MPKLPVLVLGYRRPDLTSRVMQAVHDYGPVRLYVACDGPKPGQEEEVQAVRNVLASPSWPTQLNERFLDTNAGVREAITGAINWFFSSETKGIILEDDCIPTRDFFSLAEHILDEYEHDERVWGMTGSNTTGAKFHSTYGFIQHSLTWGWATWANRWASNDSDLATYQMRPRFSRNKWPSKAHKYVFQRHLDSIVLRGIPDTWDYQWAWTVMKNRGLWVVPSFHLVENVGFGDSATNTKVDTFNAGPLETLGEIIPPEVVEPNREAEIAILGRIHGLVTPQWLNVPINILKKLKTGVALAFTAARRS